MSRPYYVRMTDQFFSGWGVCEGKKNVLVIVCETWEQAAAIECAANDRHEMKRVTIMREFPRQRPGIMYSVKYFENMLGDWRKYYRVVKTECGTVEELTA